MVGEGSHRARSAVRSSRSTNFLTRGSFFRAQDNAQKPNGPSPLLIIRVQDASGTVPGCLPRVRTAGAKCRSDGPKLYSRILRFGAPLQPLPETSPLSYIYEVSGFSFRREVAVAEGNCKRSAMNPDKFTHKTNEALVSARELALDSGHAQFTPLHLASILVADRQGLLPQALANASEGAGDSAVQSFERVVSSALKKLPSQSPPPDDVPVATSLVKAIRRAQSSQKSCGDSHLAVDQLILGLLEDSQIADLLKEAGISVCALCLWVFKIFTTLRIMIFGQHV